MLKTEVKLDPIQQLKLELYREFEDEAEKVYNFIAGRDGVTAVAQSASAPIEESDGVYIIYKDGSYSLFTGENNKDNVAYVGVKLGSKRIAVALHDLGGDGKEYRFLKKNFDALEESDFYLCNRGISAQEDFNGAINTQHIKNDYETEIPLNLLEDGEHIPSIGEWTVLTMFASAVNVALRYVGGTPIKGWRWSSTENSQSNACYVNFTDGYTSNYGYKFNSGSVRAVAAF